MSKEDIVDILNACSDIRLKTYVMFLAAGGFRAVEALLVRIKDLDLNSKPVKVFVRGEYIKTKTDRVVFLTEEVAQQLTSWLTYKYRKRRVCYNRNSEQDVNKKKTVTEYRIPDKKENDLIFAIYQNKKIPNPDGIYDDIAKSFARTLADIQTKVEELEELNRSLRQRDKIKDGAIAHLSDQLVSLSARLQEIEREQQV